MGRKLMVVFGEPMRKENNHYLYSCTRDILKEKGRNISVDVQGMEKKPSQLRKYGKLGWVYIQILQYKNALQAVRRTAPGDIILSQDFGTGRLCSYIAMKKHTERKVLAMNCLQRRGGGILRRIEKRLDAVAWSNENLITTSNTLEDIAYLTLPEYRKNKVYVLPDCYNSKSAPMCDGIKYDCMTGGYANRDFELFFKAAAKRPGYRFCCVVGSNFSTSGREIPKNVTFLKDIPEKEFFKVMAESRGVAMPLTKKVASGLVVIKNAISFGIPVLVTDTPAVENYIPKTMEECLFQLGDTDEFLEKLDSLLNMDDSGKEKQITSLQQHCEKMYGRRSTCGHLVELMEQNGFFDEETRQG